MHAHTRETTGVTVLLAALLSVLVGTSARAELKRLDMRIDGFYTPECPRDITHALSPYEDDYEALTIAADKHRVTFVPKKDVRVKLWQIIRQLERADRIPVRTTVLASGKVADHQTTLGPREVMLTRKAFVVDENGLRFLINNGQGLADTLEASENGAKPVAVFGELIAWDEYALPILVVKKAKPADAEWSDAELEELISPKEK